MRVRTALASVVVVGAALVVASVAMVFSLRRSLTDDVRASARLRADAVAADVRAGAALDEVRVGDAEEELVQVVDGSGRVVASSANVAGAGPVTDVEAGDARRVEGLPFEDDPFLVVAVDAGGGTTVLAGRTLETVTESSAAAAGLLAAGVPLLLVVVGVAAWWMAGRALAPVEAMRAQVEAISAAQLHRRVPRPAGDDEIARLAATMNGMLARLDAAQERQRRLVSDASHELRSPVAAIRQHAEVALTHPSRATVEDLARTVLAESGRLERLVDDLLLLTRMDERGDAATTDPVDLDDLLLDEAARLRDATALRIDTRAVSAGRVRGHAGRLGRLVRNLADNAARHAASAIAFSLRAADGVVVLTVDDDGDGVPPADRERVFERFVRLDAARARDVGGSGLGLAIVAEIATAHRATVAVGRAPLGGARFEVRFPGAE